MSVSLAAEPLTHLGSLPITNALLNSWIAVSIIIALGAVLRVKKSRVPKGIQNAAEAVIELFLNFIDQVTQNRAKSKKFLPIVGSLFLFIVLSNLLAQIPGTGTIGLKEIEHGIPTIIPLLRPATSDLTIGFFQHANKFINLGGIWQSFRHGGIAIFTAVIEFMVGLIELVSEVAKILSLSLRLFGNIFAGEVLLTVLSSLVAFLMPLPFQFLELIVAVIQAMVFSMLTLVYLEIATTAPHGNEETPNAAAASAHS
ncbi:MAG: ATP synthase F0 subunit A, F-type H+-transporting ATPase subunit a [Candidatus Magasanikbacteria bacterium]|nr:ATP synthase F0 subunit A, F-type H+-transporting ATPase subunit a [Candidatus Magasanikbacteria bacterium]